MALGAPPEVQVVLLTAAMTAAAALAYLFTPDRSESFGGSPWWAFVVAAILFGVVEYTVFNVHFRRQGISFNLSEIPMAIALVYLTPGATILARIPVALLVLLFLRKNQPYKLAFNLVLGVVDAAFTVLLFRLLVDSSASFTAQLLAIGVALVIVSPVGSVLISIAISRFEGGLRQRITDELSASWWMYPVNVVLAVMVVALMSIEPLLGLLAVLPVAGIWYVLHSYGEIAQELRDLDTVHGFAGRIAGSLDVDEIADAAVSEMAASFRATSAALVRFVDDEPVVHRQGPIDLALPSCPTVGEWTQLIRSGEPRILTAEEAAGQGIDLGNDVPAILVAPISDDTGTSALAVVVQADTYGHAFDAGDVNRLRNMSQQLAVSLRRGFLHERLEYEARHDALTDLPARILFERAVASAIDDLGDWVWVVMMLDLDRFKEVNDTLGHHAGDTLLVEFSRRISSLLRDDDHLARLSGDEFAILARRRSHDDVIELARNVVRTGGQPVTLDGLEIVVTVSVGVADVTELDNSPLEPMRRADIAMYNAKWQRTGVELYRDEIDRRTPARLSMLGDLRAAIVANDLDVVYQPKLDLATGAVVGVEALVRWEHETRGVVAPTEFVRVAEDTGLIKDLTDLVLARGIAALRRFVDAGLGLDLAVNLSTHDLFDARLPDRVRAYLDECGVEPESLTLEITESSLLVDAPRTRATIDELHAVGLKLAVDDFGTGYSSLSYLRRLPVHELKIDQSFVSGMETDPQDEVIVRSTVDLGHNLGLRVVAEGVESRPVLDQLRAFGCDVAQGYGISQPLSADELIEWVRAVRADSDPRHPWLAVG